MKTSIKYESDTRVKITIALSPEEIQVAENKAISGLSRTLKVPGFRKGKVPPAVAKKQLEPERLQEETANLAINQAVAEVFVNNDLRALDRPAVSVTKFVPGEVIEFSAEVDIMPDIKLGDYNKLKLSKLDIDITESEVKLALDRVRQGLADKEEVKRPAKLGDEVIIDFIGKKEDKVFDGGSGNDYPLRLGSNQFIPGFEEAVVGHKIGDKFITNVKFPDDYGSAELKGQKATFEIKLKSVKQLSLPKLDDSLAKRVGNFKTLKDLKSDIKQELTNQKKYEAQEKQKESLVEQLVKISKIPTPEVLIQDHIKAIEQDFTKNLTYKGISIEQYLENQGFKNKEEWLVSEVRDLAIKRVKSGLALSELSKAENVIVEPKEVDKIIEGYKQHYSKNKDMLDQFNRTEVKQDIANRLLIEKTIEQLIKINS